MSLSPEDLRRAAPYLVGDPALSSLVAAKQTAEVEYSKLKRAGLGENHPDVARVKAVIEELEVKISDQLQGLKTGVQADYEAVQAQADTLTALMEEMKASEISAEASGYREFEAARQELERVRRIRDSLEMRYIEERIKLRIPSTTVEVVEPARPVSLDDPVRPKVLLNVLLSILLGVGSGIGLAYFVEYLDTSVKTIEDIERHMGISVLGVIPQKVKPLNDVAAEAAHAEAYRVLRTNIHFSEKFRDGRTLCITSGSVGEGKSLTIFNLAYICAQLGDRVLIVDSDLHRPRQHRLLNAAKNPGLANILVGEIGFPDAVVQTSVPNLDLLPSGRLSAEVHGLLDTEKMRGLIREVKGRYGTVFFDAPPIIGVSDASLLVREMDGTLLVIQHRKYPRAISSRARDMIENVGGNLLGVVLNNINITRDYTYYYYQHHYYSYPQRAAVGDQT